MKKHGHKLEAKKAAKVIDMGEPAAEHSDEDPNKIDDEETGGEWITEENLHKHLSHGVVLPIVPTTTEVAEEIKPLNIGGDQ